MELPNTFHELDEKLGNYVFSEDKTIGWVLKCHLLTEGLLERIIRACIPSGEALLQKSSFTYRQKLELACSLEVLSDEIILALRTLNNLRNSCAHELKTHINLEQMKPLGMAFGKEEFSRFLEESEENEEHFLGSVIGFLVGVLGAECDQIEVQRKCF